MLSMVVAILVSTIEPVPVAGGVSPDGAFEVALEADHDTPRFVEYEFKGGDEQFPAVLVLERGRGTLVRRVPWPGAASETEVLLRNRTQVKWRSDSAAVAINTRDAFYAHSLVLALDPKRGRFAEVPIPPYAELTGRLTPPDERLRSRGRNIAINWTPEGLLAFEVWLWGDVDYPISYRVSLRLSGGRFVVQDRKPIVEGTPSW